MTHDKFALALAHPELFALLLEPTTQLDWGRRRRLEQFFNELKQALERHHATQDALRLIQDHTLWKVEQSLTAATQLKAARHPHLPQEELDAFETAARQLYLESAATVMQKAMRKVLDQHDQ